MAVGGLDELLDQDRTVRTGVVVAAVEVGVDRIQRLKQLYARALAAAVGFEHQRRTELTGGVADRLLADGNGRTRHADFESAERSVLLDLADFEFQGAAIIDDAAAVRAKPGQHACGVFRRVDMAARMRRRAHPVVEDTRRRRAGKIEIAAIEMPLRIGSSMSGRSSRG